MSLSHSYSSIKMYENCPKRYYHQRITKEVEDVGSAATIYGTRVHADLEERLANGKKLTEETSKHESLCSEILKTKSEVLVEQKMCLTKEFTPTTWMAKDAWFRSIVDVLLLNEKSATVMDWKTGKRRPDFMQLELFAMQVFFHYPKIEKVITSFVWLKELGTDTKVFKRDKDLQSIINKFLIKLKHIYTSVKTDNWIPKPSGLCRFCPCNNFCKYAV